MTDPETMKRIYEQYVPDMNGTPVSPTQGPAGGAASSQDAPPAQIIPDGWVNVPCGMSPSFYSDDGHLLYRLSKQYTPSGSFHLDNGDQIAFPWWFCTVLFSICIAAVLFAKYVGGLM